MSKNKRIKLEDYGYCSKTGKCINPFGVKPEWVQNLAEKLQQKFLVKQTKEAPF